MRGRATSGIGRPPRRDRADGRQLTAEPDVPLPRRRTARGFRRRLPRRDAVGTEGCGPLLPQALRLSPRLPDAARSPAAREHRPADNPARRYHRPRDDGRRAGRGLRLSRDGPRPAARTRPTAADRRRPRRALPVHALQPVYADDLLAHAVPAARVGAPAAVIRWSSAPPPAERPPLVELVETTACRDHRRPSVIRWSSLSRPPLSPAGARRGSGR
ncbi:Uncharacterised protein [Mycobacteroides abscessus subsp. abscessus]|nr:Uncharacterised protein [Mycobacteroides abscessus subsp. abscessus]